MKVKYFLYICINKKYMIPLFTLPEPFSWTLILAVLFISFCLSLPVYFLGKSQRKFVETLKPGDKVYLVQEEAEVIEKLGHNEFVVKATVKGMKLGKRTE